MGKCPQLRKPYKRGELLNGALNKHMGIMVRCPQTFGCVVYLFLYSLTDSVLLVLFSDFICSVVGSPLSLLESLLPLAWITMGAEIMPLSEYILFLSPFLSMCHLPLE